MDIFYVDCIIRKHTGSSPEDVSSASTHAAQTLALVEDAAQHGHSANRCKNVLLPSNKTVFNNQCLYLTADSDTRIKYKTDVLRSANDTFISPLCSTLSYEIMDAKSVNRSTTGEYHKCNVTYHKVKIMRWRLALSTRQRLKQNHSHVSFSLV